MTTTAVDPHADQRDDAISMLFDLANFQQKRVVELIKKYRGTTPAIREEQRLFERIKKTDTWTAYLSFLAAFPNSNIITPLMAQKAIFEMTKRQDRLDSYYRFLKRFPKSGHVAAVKQKILAIYHRNPSFDNYVSAYALMEDLSYIQKARQWVESAPKGKKLSALDEKTHLYFDVAIKQIDQIPTFSKMVGRLDKKMSLFRSKVIALPGFNKKITESNFLQSIEYRFLLNQERPSVKALVDGSQYGFTLGYKRCENHFEKTGPMHSRPQLYS